MTRRFLLAAAFGLALAASAQAQEYPTKPIRIIVPYPAGGSADLLPRIFAEKLSAKWGQPVLVENRPGAGGNIGAEFAYKAEGPTATHCLRRRRGRSSSTRTCSASSRSTRRNSCR